MIGIYAHHVGSGHLHRCRAIQAELPEPSVIFSSAAGADVPLPLDTSPEGRTADKEAARTANGTLHWAPTDVAGLRDRMAQLAQWITRHEPRVFYVDVSVEVALFIRLMGIPVVTLAMPGIRNDAVHQLGYRQADALIAAWPDWVPVPEHLAAHTDRLHQVGGITRLQPQSGIPRQPRIVVLQGKGGDDWRHEMWQQIADQRPQYHWEFLGGDNRVTDPMPHLQTASLVIAAAGQNSVADIAAAGTPAIILAQDRPYREQEATAQVLREADLAVVPAEHPDPAQWPVLIDRALAHRPQWHRWQTTGSAARAAQTIMEVA